MEAVAVQIAVRRKDADDGFRDIQRMMFQRDVRNLRTQLETERRRARRRRRMARLETERRKILHKWKLRAILGAIICAQIGAILAVMLWRR